MLVNTSVLTPLLPCLEKNLIAKTSRNSRIKKIYEIKLERPRNRDDQEFKDFVSEITQAIHESEDE